MRPRAKRAVKSRLRGRVEAGAFNDINGVYDNNCYPVVLAGGALTSSKKQMKWYYGGAVKSPRPAAKSPAVKMPGGNFFTEKTRCTLFR